MPASQVFIIVLLAAISCLVLYSFYKIKKIHILLLKHKGLLDVGLDGLFNQMQDLDSLYRDYGFTRSLPRTGEWAACPDFLRIIAEKGMASKPKVIVECSSGVSTIVLARCAQLNGIGHIYSLEHMPEFAELTRMNLKKHGLSTFATVIDAPLKTYDLNGKTWQWYSMDSMPKENIDLLIIDGPPGDTGKNVRYPAGPLLFPKLNKGASVFLDDADRTDEKEILSLWAGENASFQMKKYDTKKGCAFFLAR